MYGGTEAHFIAYGNTRYSCLFTESIKHNMEYQYQGEALDEVLDFYLTSIIRYQAYSVEGT